MKKNIPFYLSLVMIPILALTLMGYYNGSPTAVTGSPGDNGGATCIACHQGADTYHAYNASVNITTDIPAGGYELGHQYTVTVTQTSTGAAEHGFQITAESSNVSKAGYFSLIENVNTQIQNLDGNTASHVTHTAAGGDVSTWSFYWNAPFIDQGAVTFYVATICGNKINNGHVAQNTELSTSTLTINGVLGINKANMLNFSVYPNPSRNHVTIQLPNGNNEAHVSIMNYLGQTVYQNFINSNKTNLDISNIKSGIYIVKIESDRKIGTRKLIIQ